MYNTWSSEKLMTCNSTPVDGNLPGKCMSSHNSIGGEVEGKGRDREKEGERLPVFPRGGCVSLHLWCVTAQLLDIGTAGVICGSCVSRFLILLTVGGRLHCLTGPDFHFPVSNSRLLSQFFSAPFIFSCETSPQISCCLMVMLFYF